MVVVRVSTYTGQVLVALKQSHQHHAASGILGVLLLAVLSVPAAVANGTEGTRNRWSRGGLDRGSLVRFEACQLSPHCHQITNHGAR